jgi:hypothetical protein
MKLKEIKFELTKNNDLYNRIKGEVPKEEIIMTDYECRINDSGETTWADTDARYESMHVMYDDDDYDHRYGVWELFLSIKYDDNYICRIKIILLDDIDYVITEFVFEVGGKLITIDKNSMELNREAYFAAFGCIVNEIKIKDGSLD